MTTINPVFSLTAEDLALLGDEQFEKLRGATDRLQQLLAADQRRRRDADADAESRIADLTRVLSPRDQAVREERARLVREIWIATVLALIPDPKPSWTASFDETDDFQREVDARIGEGVAAAERERIAGDVITRGDLERAVIRLAEITGNRDNYYPALANDMFRYAHDHREEV